MWLLLLVIVTHKCATAATFSPDTSNFDAYGVKLAANNVLLVEAQGKSETFLVLFAPYNYTLDSLQCSVDYDDDTHYVYTVGVGPKQTAGINPHFFYAGEVVPAGTSTTDSLGHSGTFVGIWVNQDPQTVQSYVGSGQPLSCNYFDVGDLKFISSYGHQEFFVLGVEPYGQYAIGLAQDFAFIYRPFPTGTITTKSSSLVWPSNTTFRPHAVDTDQTFTIVAGFVESSARSRVRATPTVYLISNSNLTVLASWSYTAINGSWQSHLAYSGTDTWSKSYTMSVSINSDDPTRVLVGMPFLNTVFLFVVGNSGTTLTLTDSINTGQSVGFGKAVTWLTSSQAAILVSIYSLDYSTWYLSKIYLYTSFNGTTLPSQPTAVIPNTQQPQPSTISTELIQIVSTPASLGILDVNGGVLLIVAQLPGYYASTDTSHSPIAAAMPVISHSTTCIGGTFKADTGVHPGVLCPSGSRNSGGMGALGTFCTNCSSGTFCPLGAVYEVSSTSLATLSQAYAYPSTPERSAYDDVLLAEMFSMGSTTDCLRASPLFWTLMVLIIAAAVIVTMGLLKLFVRHPKGEEWRAFIKKTFQRTDLVVSTKKIKIDSRSFFGKNILGRR
jgi:hypothetical protein